MVSWRVVATPISQLLRVLSAKEITAPSENHPQEVPHLPSRGYMQSMTGIGYKRQTPYH